MIPDNMARIFNVIHLLKWLIMLVLKRHEWNNIALPNQQRHFSSTHMIGFSNHIMAYSELSNAD